MIQQHREGVPAGWSQAQQHMTSLPTGRLIGGRLWQASRVELAPDQPQRSFAPCGNQRRTPTNSRKQTIERGELCRCDLLLRNSHVTLWWVKYLTRLLQRVMFYCFSAKKRKKERKKKKEKNSPAWTTRTGTTEEKNKTKKQASSMLSLHHDSLKESDDIISSCFWKKSFLILHLLKTIFHQIIVGSICSLRDHVICNQGDIECFLFLNRCEWQLIELSSQVHTLQWCINARFTIQLYPVRIIYIKLSFFPPDRVGGGTMTSS